MQFHCLITTHGSWKRHAPEEDVEVFAGEILITVQKFTETVELIGAYISTFLNFPDDIRARISNLSGMSGFQLKFVLK